MKTRFLITIFVFAALTTLGCSGGSGGSGSGDPSKPLVFEWNAIPPQNFAVGLETQADLRNFLSDPSGAATITIDADLPEGLSWSNGRIEGMPAVQSATLSYTATANDGSEAIQITFSLTVHAAPPPTDLQFERATPEQIGIYLPLAGAPDSATTATVRYRPTGESTWKTAMPLIRIHPEWVSHGAPVAPVDSFAGSIFDLTPGTLYDIEVTITEPGDSPELKLGVTSTRALPFASLAPTVQATPADDLQAMFDGLTPGDVLELANGTYDVDRLHIDVSGTANAPITIRGESRSNVILRDTGGRIIQVVDSSHVVIENMTLQGSGIDSGASASSVGVGFWDGAPTQEFFTFRNLTITGVDRGIIGWSAINSVLIYQCKLTGNNEWNSEFVDTGLTWNDDGLRIPGVGNCAFDNDLTAFGDTCAVQNSVFSAAIYFYRNRITSTGDDACEGDYGTRNMGFYDNHITNCSTLLSLDPLWGGPFYCFRNIVINTVRGPFKLNDTNSGFMIDCNTIVRTDGKRSLGWIQFNNGALRQWTYRNNILVYHGPSSKTYVNEATVQEPIDFHNNAWYPDGKFQWSANGGTKSSLSDAAANLPSTLPFFGSITQRHQNDVLILQEPFTARIPLGPTHLTEVTSFFVPTLAGGSAAAGTGVAIPNITDGFAGVAPDMGALITGRSAPTWGAD